MRDNVAVAVRDKPSVARYFYSAQGDALSLAESVRVNPEAYRSACGGDCGDTARKVAFIRKLDIRRVALGYARVTDKLSVNGAVVRVNFIACKRVGVFYILGQKSLRSLHKINAVSVRSVAYFAVADVYYRIGRLYRAYAAAEFFNAFYAVRNNLL